MLGDLDGGFAVAMDTLDLFRPSVGAFAVGMAQAALDAAVALHAGARGLRRSRCSHFQAVSHQLAEVATEIEAARLLVRDAGHRSTTRRPAGAQGLRDGQALRHRDGAARSRRRDPGPRRARLQKGHLLEHLYREVRAPRIYEGASEVQREIIARELFKEAG